MYRNFFKVVAEREPICPIKQPAAAHYPSSKGVIRVYLAASELHPFWFSGGLSQAVRGMAEGLRDRGHDITVFVPKHLGSTEVASADHNLPLKRIECMSHHTISLPGQEVRCKALQTFLPPQEKNIRVVFVDSPDAGTFESRGARGAYGQTDDPGRYFFFNHVIAHMVSQRQPHENAVVHTHDWHTAYVPLLLRTRYLNKDLPTLHTIHNLQYYSRVCRHDFWRMTGLTEEAFPQLLSETGINFPPFSDLADPSAAAFRIADHINTVSKSYVAETLGEELGHGYQHLLRRRFEENMYTGIVNGVDASWIPNYDHTNFSEAKMQAKKIVQHKFGLPEKPNSFLIMMASRFDAQKGYELVTAILEKMIVEYKMDFQFIVSADATDSAGREIVNTLHYLQNRFPKQIAIKDKYDDELTHLNYTGADLVLSPSRFEPCGLVAPTGIMHGTPCVGRLTGGMRDIVKPGKNGWLFEGWWYGAKGDMAFNYLTQGFLKQIDHAYKLYGNQDSWKPFVAQLIKTGRQELTWKNSAKQYEQLYREIIARYERPNGGPYRAFGHF